MFLIYAYLVLSSLSIVNCYVVWLFIEIAFLFFLLFILNQETKNIALVIYFLFQRFCSVVLFIGFFYSLQSLVFITIIAKLGLFPFFYWLVLVSIKTRILTNFFILIFQKLPSLWLFWLTRHISISSLYLFVYLNIFFVIINLILVSDLWLLLVYSSISNTSLLLLRVQSSFYFLSIFIYLFVLIRILTLLWKRNSSNEVLMVTFFFLTVPPFFLFFIKLIIVSRLEFSLKLRIFAFIFDVFVLLYYFRLIFIKFILIERRFLIYMLNMLILLRLMLLRN